MARLRGIGRRCLFESLEDRRLLAGDVTAKIVNGDLLIKGDNLDNGIAITAGAAAGDVVVTGINAGGSATNVNGAANGAVTLSGFSGNLTIKMKGGNDSVSITGITTDGKAKIKGGSGDDTFDISESTFDSTAKVLGRGGSDDATITDSTFSDLGVSLGRGDDLLTVSDTTVSDKTNFNGRGGTNTYTDGGDNSLADLAIPHFNDTSSTTPSNGVKLNPISDIAEGSAAVLTGTYTDSDTSSSQTLSVDWDDPNSDVDSTFAIPSAASLTTGQTIDSSTDDAVLTVTSVGGGQVGFSVQHRYLDDGLAAGSSTNSDTSTIAVTVTDGSTFNASSTTTVTVNDSAPSVALDAVADVTENGAATLTGSYTDSGLLDAQTLAVSWGDPNNSAASTFDIPAVQNADGTSSLTVGQTFNSSTDAAILTVTSINNTSGQVGFSVQHKYVDDGKVIGNLTLSDTSTISVSVTDDDAKTGANSTGVKVNDAVPTLLVNTVPDISVNGPATLTGTFSDIGLSDEHGLLVNWGDNTSSQFRINAIHDPTGAATLSVGQMFNSTIDSDNTVLKITSIDASTGQVGFSVQHQYTATGTSIPISIGVSDDDTGNTSASTTVTVHPVQPTVTVNPIVANENDTVTLAGSFTNIVVTDTHDLTVSWADANNSNDSTFAVPATNGLSVGQTVNSSTDSAVLTITSVNTTTGQVGFLVKHQYVDDGASSTGNATTSDDSSVLVFVTGSTAGSGFSFATVTVKNVSPTVAMDPVSDINQNSTATLTGTYTDIGLSDAHTLTIDWNDPNSSNKATFTIDRTTLLSMNGTFNSTTDGSILTITSINTSTGAVGFSVQHGYTASGSTTVGVTVADDDLGSGSTTVSFVVRSV